MKIVAPTTLLLNETSSFCFLPNVKNKFSNPHNPLPVYKLMIRDKGQIVYVSFEQLHLIQLGTQVELAFNVNVTTKENVVLHGRQRAFFLWKSISL